MRKPMAFWAVLLSIAGFSTVTRASAIVRSTQDGNGLLRVQGYDDESVGNAMLRISTNGRFHIRATGVYPLDLRGDWHQVTSRIYDLTVDDGFGDAGANGSGRVLIRDGQLDRFEISGVTDNDPYYVSFGANGYPVPQPGPDGFSLGLSIGRTHYPGYYYAPPSISAFIVIGAGHRGHRPPPPPDIPGGRHGGHHGGGGINIEIGIGNGGGGRHGAGGHGGEAGHGGGGHGAEGGHQGGGNPQGGAINPGRGGLVPEGIVGNFAPGGGNTTPRGGKTTPHGGDTGAGGPAPNRGGGANPARGGANTNRGSSSNSGRNSGNKMNTNHAAR